MRKLLSAMAMVLALVLGVGVVSGCLVRTTRARRERVVVRERHDHGRHRGHQRGRGNPHRN